MSTTVTYEGITAPRFGAEENERQIIAPKKPYVHGTGRNNALLHVINYVQLRWWTWEPNGDHLTRLNTPRMFAFTKCGAYFRIDSTKAKMCELPKPDAVVCKSCLKEGRNFPRGKRHDVPLALAKVRLGCIEQPL